MRSSGPLETKVAASSGGALLVTTVFAVLHWLDPHLSQPPAYVTGLLAVLVSLAFGYLAPHTSRSGPAVKPGGVVLPPPSATGTGPVSRA